MYKTFTTALRASEMQSPFGGWRHHFSPASGGTITRAYCRAAYEESVSRCFILPPCIGGSPAEPDRGVASAASQSAECLSYHMTQKGESVTLTSYSSPVRAIPSPSEPSEPFELSEPGPRSGPLYPLYPPQITLENCYFLYIIQIKYSNRRGHEFLIHEIFPYAG